IFVLYEWAQNKYGGLWSLFIYLVVLLVLLLFFHESLLEVSLVLLAVMASMFATVFWKIRKEFFYF
ncbi:MAG TPA: hypothetical protein VJ044_02375, partial [Candidatus Hodarchaeales archaeon]|nr:hypothetical protein [Candidatus Hodarchaeales archaeon]